MIQVEKKYLGLMMEAGYIYVGMGRFKDARKVFEGISILAPESELPVVALGSVYFCEGKFPQAIKQYEVALKLNPKSDYAFAYMGEVLFFSKKKKEAMVALSKAKELDPKGKAADFASALIKAIDGGFTPAMVAGVVDKE